MKLIIHDMKRQPETNIPSEDTNTVIIHDDGNIKNCIGCFGCWVKTPGHCILKDTYQELAQMIAGSEEITIISQCVYGSYSPFIRNVFDRILPYVLPYLGIYDGEMHHKPRHKSHHPLFTVYFYGENISPLEKETARKLVVANAKNFHFSDPQTKFITAPEQPGGLLI